MKIALIKYEKTIKDSVGTYDSKFDGEDYFNCILKFKFFSHKLEIVTQSKYDVCGFGGNVYADHEYKLINKILQKYFINGHSDTILFKGLTVEKYNHRFD